MLTETIWKENTSKCYIAVHFAGCAVLLVFCLLCCRVHLVLLLLIVVAAVPDAVVLYIYFLPPYMEMMFCFFFVDDSITEVSPGNAFLHLYSEQQ